MVNSIIVTKCWLSLIAKKIRFLVERDQIGFFREIENNNLLMCTEQWLHNFIPLLSFCKDAAKKSYVLNLSTGSKKDFVISSNIDNRLDLFL